VLLRFDAVVVSDSRSTRLDVGQWGQYGRVPQHIYLVHTATVW